MGVRHLYDLPHMHTSTGPLRYSVEPFKLHVDVDPGIVQLARALLPKSLRLNVTRYAPHISVIRNEIPPDLTRWGEHEGFMIPFEYDRRVFNDETYYWLRVFSPMLTRIREDLGLQSSSEWSRPPDGAEVFHVTIGNTKQIAEKTTPKGTL